MFWKQVSHGSAIGVLSLDDTISSAVSDPLSGSRSPLADTDDSGASHSTSSSDSDFIIPELPSGSKLELNIHSTWGDRHYVGLNGIEVFSSTGEPVSVGKVISDKITNYLRINGAIVACL